jgi:parallel beta-helix repeat protein
MSFHRDFSRRELLFGAGAAAVAGLVACDRASFVSLPAAGSGFAMPGFNKSRTIVVSQPTGAAIQAAIDELAARGGGTVKLTATVPYVVKKTIFIGNPRGSSPAVSNITLQGKGPDVTSLVAADGAHFYSSDYGEYLLFVDYASNVSIEGIEIDTINKGVRKLPRIALCVLNSKHILVGDASFVNNQGPNGYNQGLAFLQSTYVTAENCVVDRGRVGISIWQCSKFTLNRCTVTNGAFVKGTKITGPYFPGSMVALGTQYSSSGTITRCELDNNAAYGGIEVENGQDVRVTFCKVRRTLEIPDALGNDGISVNYCSKDANVTVENCEALDNSGSGISTYDSTNVTIKDCKVVSGIWPHVGAGIGFNGATKNVRAIGNRVYGSESPRNGSGIQAGTAVSGKPDINGSILNNHIQNYNNGIFLGPLSSGLVVEHNVLSSDTTCISQQPGGHNTVKNNSCEHDW